MDQAKIVDNIEEKILEKLPETAIVELAELANRPGDNDQKVQAILDKHHIDVNKITEEVLGANHHE